ncbi:hypothetical protein [Bradyrhizobium sp. Leaf401]|nr:hypothetical protein [Bradyrhizobium sp. Leaf401]
MSDETRQQFDRFARLPKRKMAGGAGMQKGKTGRGEGQSMPAKMNELIMLARTVQHGRIILDELHIGVGRPQGLLHEALGTRKVSGRGFRDAQQMYGLQIVRIFLDNAFIQFRGTCDIPHVMQGKRPV